VLKWSPKINKINKLIRKHEHKITENMELNKKVKWIKECQNKINKGWRKCPQGNRGMA
jgi:hypothetical protein